VYIADLNNHRIRKVTASTGIITTFAGTGTASYSGDNGPATSATLQTPSRVTLDSAGTSLIYKNVFLFIISPYLGNVYISDMGNDRIRKVTVSTGIITNIAGSSTSGSYSGDNGPATSAGLNEPRGIALDALGNLYIADYHNNRIRKVTVSTGIITTVAGTGASSYSGDNGPATSATLYNPKGVALDSAGTHSSRLTQSKFTFLTHSYYLDNVYIADSNNYRIRKVTVSLATATPRYQLIQIYTLYFLFFCSQLPPLTYLLF